MRGVVRGVVRSVVRDVVRGIERDVALILACSRVRNGRIWSYVKEVVVGSGKVW